MTGPPRSPAAPVLLASGLGDTGSGGLFALEDHGPTTLDRLSTTGVAVSDDGTRLARLLWTDEDPQSCGEVLVHDRRGVVRYHRVDELQEPHSLLWSGEDLIAVSTLTNHVLWIDPAGRVTKRWRAPTAGAGGDAWHLNSLVRHDGRLLVSAFGRFDHHRQWSTPGVRAGAGLVIDVASGATVLRGFSAPHDPLPYEDGWLICNSADGKLLRLDATGAVLHRVDLGGWTRGLTYDADHVYVGVSAPRHHGMDGSATVRRLDRATLIERRRWELPCSDIFALAWVSPALVEGVRAGFGANPRRAQAGERLGPADDHGADAMTPADAYDASVSLLSPLPASSPAGQALVLDVRVRNDGSATLRAAGDVRLGARWIAANGEPGPQARARLPAPLLPGATDDARILVLAPTEPGQWVLRVALVHEHLHWFDDFDPARGVAAAIELRPAP